MSPSILLREVQIEAFFNGIEHFTWKKLRNEQVILEGMTVDTFEPSIWGKWQFLLKMVAQHNQNGQCICGKRLNGYSELHHALISRKDVMGRPEGDQVKIHHSFNVLELHPYCHKQATREQCLKYLNSIYDNEPEKWFYEVSKRYA